jgi:pimeloyl-ACP methyl ester carboxylesterase
LGCPHSVATFLVTTFIILFFILQAPLYQKIKDFGFLVKYYIIFNLPLVLLYISSIGVTKIQFDESITDISTLTLASTASNSLLLALIFKDSFMKSKVANNIILLIVFLATMSVWGGLAKRGAILWFFVTLIIYFIFQSKNIKVTVFKFLLILVGIYMMMPAVISIIENFSPFLAERVEMTLVEGHTSGRMEEEGAYQVPVLFVEGECDPVCPVDCVKEYMDKITAPKKELAVFEGCGHSPNYDEPEEFAKLMKGLLE